MNTQIAKEQNRIFSLDVIRGFAILGILLMNIQSFSMISQAYLNPMAFGNLEGLNKWVYALSNIGADQKFMSIFSILFGASMVMIISNVEKRGGSSLKAHYSRNFWLLIIGLIHAYGLWYGDILTYYAICAMLLYPFRKLKPKKAFILGLVVFSVAGAIGIQKGNSLLNVSHEIIEKLNYGWKPHERIVKTEINAYHGDYMSQLTQRTKTTIFLHTKLFHSFYLWRICGLMLIGMAMFRSGFIQGKWNTKHYKIIAWVTLIIGATLVITGLIKNFQHNWTIQYSKYFGAQYNYFGSLLMAVSYISMMILISKSKYFKSLGTYVSNVGRTALSNYLGQTIICSMVFYGTGLGLFGHVSRIEQLGIVVLIWKFQIVVTNLWLRYFRFGPMEWMWRSLSLGKFQSMSK